MWKWTDRWSTKVRKGQKRSEKVTRGQRMSDKVRVDDIRSLRSINGYKIVSTEVRKGHKRSSRVMGSHKKGHLKKNTHRFYIDERFLGSLYSFLF